MIVAAWPRADLRLAWSTRLIRGVHAHALQDVPSDAQCEFVLADEYLSQCLRLEQPGFVLVVRKQDNLYFRIEPLRDTGHPADIDGVRCRNHQHAGAGDVRLDQDRGLGRIAQNRRDIAVAKLCHQFTFLLGDHIGNSACIESASAMRRPTRP